MKTTRIAPFDYRKKVIAEEGTLSYIHTIKDGPGFQKDHIIGIEDTQISIPSPHFKLDITLSAVFIAFGIALYFALTSVNWLTMLTMTQTILVFISISLIAILLGLATLGTLSRAGRSLTAVNNGSFNQPEEFFETIYITRLDNPTYHSYKGPGTILDKLYSNLPAPMDVNPVIIKSPELYEVLRDYTQALKTTRTNHYHRMKQSILSEMTRKLVNSPHAIEETVKRYSAIINSQIEQINQKHQASTS